MYCAMQHADTHLSIQSDENHIKKITSRQLIAYPIFYEVYGLNSLSKNSQLLLLFPTGLTNKLSSSINMYHLNWKKTVLHRVPL